MKLCGLLFLFLLPVFAESSAPQPNKADLQRIAAYLQKRIDAAAKVDLLSRRGQIPGDMVIVPDDFDDKLFRVSYTPGQGRVAAFIIVWVNEKGPSPISIIDDNMDGVVEYGSYWSGAQECRVNLNWGMIYRAGYQALYNRAIAAALRYIKTHKE